MSRVLARNMFKKNAPKRSSKGVGITSVFEDDPPAYAEGGEVEVDDRREREKEARMLLEKNRDENEHYQRFTDNERPQMSRLPATAGMMPSPQQLQAQQMQAQQAMQMQRMAQMGMVPRFAEGGQVEVPSMWSRVKDFLWNPPGMDRPPTLAEMRRDMGRSIGIPALTNTGRSGEAAMNDPNAMTPAISPDEIPTPMYRNPVTAQLSEQPQPRQYPPEGTMTRPDSIGGERPVMIPSRDESRVLRAQERTPPSEDESGREASRAAAFSKLVPKEDPEDTEDQGDQGPPDKKVGPKKPSDLTDIKAERAAKQEAMRRENMWLAMMQAGLAIAGGKSSNAITNIGQGGQAGLASFMALEQQRRKDEDAAMRRDIAERELQLQTRKLGMMEPYYAAQTKYIGTKGIRDENAQKMKMAVARQRAEEAAGKSWENMVKTNPKYMTMSEPARMAQKQLYVTQEANRLFPIKYQEILVGMPGTGTRDEASVSGED